MSRDLPARTISTVDVEAASWRTAIQGSSRRDEIVSLWEHHVLEPHDKTRLANEAGIKAVVDYVWSDMGLSHPPVFELRPPSRAAMACATAGKLLFFGPQTSVTLLHELAHVMTLTMDECLGHAPPLEESHGDVWLACYVHLLDRYIRPLNKGYLMLTLSKYGLRPSWSPTIRCDQ